jgi:hypothetical protein
MAPPMMKKNSMNKPTSAALERWLCVWREAKSSSGGVSSVGTFG